jgi:oligoendopeptidase F
MPKIVHCTLTACLVITSGLTFAQDTTQKPSIDTAQISKNLYFTSGSAEVTSRLSLHTRVAETVSTLPNSSVRSLATNLGGAEELFVALQRHLAYIKVNALENTDDHAIKEAGDQVAADQSILDAAVMERLRKLPASAIPSLGKYAYLARQAQADKAHALSPDAERYRGAVTVPAESDIGDAYDQLDGTMKSSKDIVSKDTAKRRSALKLRTQTYDRAAPAEAALLGSLVELENRDAVAQGFPNAAERKYESLDLTSTVVDHMLAAVRSHASVYQHYQQVRADHTARALGVPSILFEEQEMVITAPNQISLPKARQMILAALQPLGPDYTRRFATLLDPMNGRLDLTGGSHRANAGTSISAYDAPTALYYDGYDGSLRSVSKIIHEGGHTIHRELMNSSGIPVYEREGPHYLFESYAIFNELLLLDQATRTATTPAEREYALERLLSKISLELFVSAEETTFEENLYTQASGHALLDSAKLDTVFQNAIQPYESWPMSDAGSSRNWMRKSLLWEDPLYLVNYLYASVVAIALFDKAHSDPAFPEKYEALLRRGFDADPQDLLATMNIHLDDPHLVDAASNLFESKTKELQALYATN